MKFLRRREESTSSIYRKGVDLHTFPSQHFSCVQLNLLPLLAYYCLDVQFLWFISL